MKSLNNPISKPACNPFARQKQTVPTKPVTPSRPTAAPQTTASALPRILQHANTLHQQQGRNIHEEMVKEYAAAHQAFRQKQLVRLAEKAARLEEQRVRQREAAAAAAAELDRQKRQQQRQSAAEELFKQQDAATKKINDDIKTKELHKFHTAKQVKRDHGNADGHIFFNHNPSPPDYFRYARYFEDSDPDDHWGQTTATMSSPPFTWDEQNDLYGADHCGEYDDGDGRYWFSDTEEEEGEEEEEEYSESEDYGEYYGSQYAEDSQQQQQQYEIPREYYGVFNMNFGRQEQNVLREAELEPIIEDIVSKAATAANKCYARFAATLQVHYKEGSSITSTRRNAWKALLKHYHPDKRMNAAKNEQLVSLHVTRAINDLEWL